jgi:hypothetical protein
MTKDQKRIVALEKEVKELREQVLQLAMRPQYVINTIPAAPMNPAPYRDSPFYVSPTITCKSILQGDGSISGIATSGSTTLSS